MIIFVFLLWTFKNILWCFGCWCYQISFSRKLKILRYYSWHNFFTFFWIEFSYFKIRKYIKTHYFIKAPYMYLLNRFLNTLALFTWYRRTPSIRTRIVSGQWRHKVTISMEMDCQFITIYGKFVTSQTASFSRADIGNKLDTILSLFQVSF